MVTALLFLTASFLSALSQELEPGGRRRETDAFGADASGRRGPSLWTAGRYPAGWTLEEEAAEGHMFVSPAPLG